MRYMLALLAGLVLCGTAAAGALPGVNGSIAFERNGVVAAFDPRTGTTTDVVPGTQPAWSNAVSTLAFVRDNVVYTSASDGTGVTAFGPGLWPTWSPSGDRLALVRSDPLSPQGTLQLYVVPLATPDQPQQLTFGTTDVRLPAWSPDGTRIAYGTADGLYTVAVDGSSAPQPVFTSPPVGGGPSWSPEGTRLAFVATNGQVWVVDAGGGNARQVTYTLLGPTGSSIARPAWSPDGLSIAWFENADLCTTDLDGNVRRVTFTAQSTPAVVPGLPDWQPSAGAPYQLVAATPGTNDAPGCDVRAGARIELLAANVSPRDTSLSAPQEIAFVNHTSTPLAVTTTLPGANATVDPGGFARFPTVPGSYDFTVTGYPDGAARHGTFVVSGSAKVAIDAHAPVRYGVTTVLSGAASGPAGASVTIRARPSGSTASFRVATVQPTGGRWRFSVKPTVTTSYEADFGGASAFRVVRVMPILVVRHSRETVTVSLAPLPQVARKTVFLFRMMTNDWRNVGRARTGRDGIARFVKLRAGRYYVGLPAAGPYWSTASAPFGVGS